MAQVFMTDEWAQACAELWNSWPLADRKASKLEEFWDWIEMVSPLVTGRLCLTTNQRSDGAIGDTLVLDFDQGKITSSSVAERRAVEDSATFLLAGDLEGWVEMLGGYDVGKMIMYRRLMLEHGETLDFFMAAFLWTELLTAIQDTEVEPVRAAALSGA